MTQALSVSRSTIGKKILMAGSGFVLLGFVFAHMLGNLKIFQGPEKMNAYGEFLREVGYPALGHGEILWILRLGLIAALAVHFWAAVTLARRNKQARPQGYKKWSGEESTYASRTMIWGGWIILLFVAYHLLHLTTGALHGTFEHGKPYENVIAGFQIWWVASIYVVAQLALGLHLYHGFWSMFRTLGTDNPVREQLRRGAALVFALVVVVGNISIPVAVLAGMVS